MIKNLNQEKLIDVYIVVRDKLNILNNKMDK